MGISPQAYQQITARLSGKRKPEPASGAATVDRSPARTHRTILGIDPSLRGTGYGVISIGKPHSKMLVCGTVRCSQVWERSRCLVKIAEELRAVIQQHQPTVCVIEGLFFAQNLQTALLMGEARGVCLLAAAEGGMEIFEIAPRKVKQAIVGYGAAQKQAVAKMVQRMLQLSEEPEPDAADALALTLAYAQENNRYSLTSPKKL